MAFPIAIAKPTGQGLSVRVVLTAQNVNASYSVRDRGNDHQTGSPLHMQIRIPCVCEDQLLGDPVGLSAQGLEENT